MPTATPTGRVRPRARRPPGSSRRATPSFLAEVACRDSDVVALLAQPGSDGLADGDRAVLAAGAADGDRHVALLLVQVAGEHRLQRVDVPLDERLGARQ